MVLAGDRGGSRSIPSRCTGREPCPVPAAQEAEGSVFNRPQLLRERGLPFATASRRSTIVEAVRSGLAADYWGRSTAPPI